MEQITASKRSSKGYEQINWKYSANEIKTNADDAIKYISDKIDEIVEIQDKTFKNTMEELELLFGEAIDFINQLTFFAYVSTDTEVRKISSEVDKKLKKFMIDLQMREDLFSSVKKINDQKLPLNKEDQFLLDSYMRDFRRNGLELEKNKREKLKIIRTELSKLEVEFNQILNEVDDTLIFTEKELEGVPKSTLQSFKRNSDNNYVIGTSYPEVFPILDFCKESSTREKLLTLFNNRGRSENPPKLKRALELRQQAATILGYDNHAAFVLEERLAKNPNIVTKFLSDLVNKLKLLGEDESKRLLELKKRDYPETTELYDHDRLFYQQMFMQENFKLDKEKIMQYFPLEKVLKEMLIIYQEIFDLTFEKIEQPNTWNPEVTTYKVSDSSTKEFIGHFYLDLYPRKGKFSHAAAFTLVKGRQLDKLSYMSPVSAMVANFPKPNKNQPSLLTHNQVRTLFHEFGHIVHQIVTTAKYSKFSGSKTKRDFVEAPSQMLENWLYEPEVISKISGHHKTGEPLPKELLDLIIDSKDAFNGHHYLRQLFFGTFDLTIHISPPNDIAEHYDRLKAEIALFPSLPDTHGYASFGHIMGGYDSGYYGYLWAEVISKDLYTRFKDEGILSKEVGKDYRRWILEKGGSIDENKLIENFLKRKASNKAFVEALGIP